MSVLVDSVLLGDIGATNARFSLLSNGNLSAISSFGVAEFGQFTDALAIFIKEHVSLPAYCDLRAISGHLFIPTYR
jgi:glucokinase